MEHTQLDPWLVTHNLPGTSPEERGYAMLTFVLRPGEIPLDTVCEMVTRFVGEPAEG